jgi:hypothetical protein
MTCVHGYRVLKEFCVLRRCYRSRLLGAAVVVLLLVLVRVLVVLSPQLLLL